jgi:cation:H+ antiporter
MGLWASVASFAGGTAVLWFAATRLALYADVISNRFGLGQAVVGVLLLAGITSLPEIATSFSAALTGEAALAVNNLLGSIALQVAVLAVADLIYDKRALTSVVPDAVVMLQGGINVILLAVVTLAVLTADTLVFGAGLWTWGLAAAAFYGLRKIARGGRRQPWIARGIEEKKEKHHPSLDDSNAWLCARTAIAGAAILAGGFVAARSASALAEQTGMGASFMGMAFLALATSLPEVSTVFASMQRGLYTMAISDILGTNIFNVALLFGIDIVASGEPVLGRVGVFSAVGSLIGVIVTGLFLMGLVERRDRTIWRMGIDSAAVLIVYAAGLALLYTLR